MSYCTQTDRSVIRCIIIFHIIHYMILRNRNHLTKPSKSDKIVKKIIAAPPSELHAHKF